MYTIEKTEYGLFVVIGGVLSREEIQRYVEEKEALLKELDGKYSILVDVRTVVTPDEELVDLFRISQEKSKGQLLRMSIVVSSPVIHGIIKQLGFRSGINDVTRVINSNKVFDWEEVALGWVKNGTEPDQREFTEVTQKIRVNNHK